MGFFDSIRKAFDAGGIKVRLDAPSTFRWSDASIPVTVTLVGHKEEPRTVTELTFTLEEEDEDERARPGARRSGTRISNRSSGGSLTFTRTETIELAPLQEVQVQVQVPLTPDAQLTDAAGVVGAAITAIAALGTITFSKPWYRLSVHSTVEGASVSKGTSRRIKNGDTSFSASNTLG